MIDKMVLLLYNGYSYKYCTVRDNFIPMPHFKRGFLMIFFPFLLVIILSFILLYHLCLQTFLHLIAKFYMLMHF